MFGDSSTNGALEQIQ